MKKITKAEQTGIAFANAVMSSAHMTYNAPRGRKMVKLV